ncbi:hypothetical protein [Falsibacillus albus]|nr:hypothetical protein [Falsibacillus albus]
MSRYFTPEEAFKRKEIKKKLMYVSFGLVTALIAIAVSTLAYMM